MQIHVLPGDALIESFNQSRIEGERIVCRECLIEGDLQASDLEDFWHVRAAFLGRTYPEVENSYREGVASEFEKMLALAEDGPVNLWFEYELFCQVNMWFCLSLLSEKDAEIYRVAPPVRNEDELWKGFGASGPDELEKCFERRIKFGRADIELGTSLWEAFRLRDFAGLRLLSEKKSACFPYLKSVCEAAIEINDRPKKTLEKIRASGESDFAKIFEKFARTEGVYGFGDSQVRRILEVVSQES